MSVSAEALNQYFEFDYGGCPSKAEKLPPDMVAKAINALLGAYIDPGVRAYWKAGHAETWSRDVAAYFQEVWEHLSWTTRGNICMRFKVEEGEGLPQICYKH